MNVVFIVNQKAGSGKAANIWEEYKKTLSINYTVHITEYATHATTLAMQYVELDEPTLIVAVGGDGTIHEVIEGVAGSKHIVVSVLKAGSGNDFSRAYKVFSSVEQLERYVHQDVQQLPYSEHDLGKAIIESKEVSFVNNAGFGFDALVTTSVNSSKLKSILNRFKCGGLTYVIVTLMALFRFKPFTATVKYNDKEHTFDNVWFIALSNQPYFGGGMKISPHSNTQDGLLELTVVHQLSKLKLLFMFMTVYKGTHERMKEVTMMQSDDFVICTEQDVNGHVDGEGLGIISPHTPIHCTISGTKWKLADGS